MLTKICRVDRIKDGAVDLVESVTCVDGELLDLLVIVRVCVMGISVGPEPELGVGVEGVAQDRDRVQGRHNCKKTLQLALEDIF